MYMYVCIRVFVWFVLFVLFWLFRLSRYLDIFRFDLGTLRYATLGTLLYSSYGEDTHTHIHTYIHTYAHTFIHSVIHSIIHSFIYSHLLNKVTQPPLLPPFPPTADYRFFPLTPLLTPSPGPDSEHSLSPDGTGLVFGDFVRFLV